VEAGTPAQRLCLLPSTLTNSTMLSQQSLCNIADPGMTWRGCESLRGGFFGENSSRTWTLTPWNTSLVEPTWADFNPPGVTRVSYDTLRLPSASKSRGNGSDKLTLYGFGLALNKRAIIRSTAGMLGLGVNSSFIERAVHDKLSPARSWSLYAGSQSQASLRNGGLVVGGIDVSRVDGPLHWGNVSDMAGDWPCPLRTTIADVYISLENGTRVPLMSSGERFLACIEPYVAFFRFPPGIVAKWKSGTGFDEQQQLLQGVDALNAENKLTFTEPGLVYHASRVANWSLTIALGNGYTTTVPHYELRAPLRGWNNLGEWTTVPDAVEVAIRNTSSNIGEIPTMGRIFLSQVSVLR
jgi:hypothetical protein